MYEDLNLDFFESVQFPHSELPGNFKAQKAILDCPYPRPYKSSRIYRPASPPIVDIRAFHPVIFGRSFVLTGSAVTRISLILASFSHVYPSRRLAGGSTPTAQSTVNHAGLLRAVSLNSSLENDTRSSTRHLKFTTSSLLCPDGSYGQAGRSKHGRISGE